MSAGVDMPTPRSLRPRCTPPQGHPPHLIRTEAAPPNPRQPARGTPRAAFAKALAWREPEVEGAMSSGG